MPAPNAPWIAHLLEMQYGANGLREIKFKILPGPLMTMANPPDSFVAEVARFDLLLQNMIKDGAEEYRRAQQDMK